MYQDRNESRSGAGKYLSNITYINIIYSNREVEKKTQDKIMMKKMK